MSKKNTNTFYIVFLFFNFSLLVNDLMTSQSFLVISDVYVINCNSK